MGLFLAQRWRRQPPAAVGVNWNNPLAAGLFALFNGANPSRELVRGIDFTKTPLTGAQVVSSYSPLGLGPDAPAETAWEVPAAFQSKYEPTAPPITLVCINRQTGNSGRSIGRPNGSGATSWHVGTHFGSFAGGYGVVTCGAGPTSISFDPPSFAFDTQLSSLAVLVVGATTSTIYAGYPFGGILDERSQGTPAGNFYYESGGGRAFGFLPYSDSVTKSVVLGAAYGRDISRAEVLGIFANPWQLFRPQQQRIYVGVVGSTQSFSYTASGGITFGGASAEARVAARAAAGGLTFAGSSVGARVAARLASGGLAFGGASPVSTHESTRTVQAAGGLQFGGAATVSFVGGVVGTTDDGIFGAGHVARKLQQPQAQVMRHS